MIPVDAQHRTVAWRELVRDGQLGAHQTIRCFVLRKETDKTDLKRAARHMTAHHNMGHAEHFVDFCYFLKSLNSEGPKAWKKIFTDLVGDEQYQASLIAVLPQVTLKFLTPFGRFIDALGEAGMRLLYDLQNRMNQKIYDYHMTVAASTDATVIQNPSQELTACFLPLPKDRCHFPLLTLKDLYTRYDQVSLVLRHVWAQWCFSGGTRLRIGDWKELVSADDGPMAAGETQENDETLMLEWAGAACDADNLNMETNVYINYVQALASARKRELCQAELNEWQMKHQENPWARQGKALTGMPTSVWQQVLKGWYQAKEDECLQLLTNQETKYTREFEHVEKYLQSMVTSSEAHEEKERYPYDPFEPLANQEAKYTKESKSNKYAQEDTRLYNALQLALGKLAKIRPRTGSGEAIRSSAATATTYSTGELAFEALRDEVCSNESAPYSELRPAPVELDATTRSKEVLAGLKETFDSVRETLPADIAHPELLSAVETALQKYSNRAEETLKAEYTKAHETMRATLLYNDSLRQAEFFAEMQKFVDRANKILLWLHLDPTSEGDQISDELREYKKKNTDKLSEDESPRMSAELLAPYQNLAKVTKQFKKDSVTTLQDLVSKNLPEQSMDDILRELRLMDYGETAMAERLKFAFCRTVQLHDELLQLPSATKGGILKNLYQEAKVVFDKCKCASPESIFPVEVRWGKSAQEAAKACLTAMKEVYDQEVDGTEFSDVDDPSGTGKLDELLTYLLTLQQYSHLLGQIDSSSDYKDFITATSDYCTTYSQVQASQLACSKVGNLVTDTRTFMNFWAQMYHMCPGAGELTSTDTPEVPWLSSIKMTSKQWTKYRPQQQTDIPQEGANVHDIVHCMQRIQNFASPGSETVNENSVFALGSSGRVAIDAHRTEIWVHASRYFVIEGEITHLGALQQKMKDFSFTRVSTLQLDELWSTVGTFGLYFFRNKAQTSIGWAQEVVRRCCQVKNTVQQLYPGKATELSADGKGAPIEAPTKIPPKKPPRKQPCSSNDSESSSEESLSLSNKKSESSTLEASGPAPTHVLRRRSSSNLKEPSSSAPTHVPRKQSSGAVEASSSAPTHVPRKQSTSAQKASCEDSSYSTTESDSSDQDEGDEQGEQDEEQDEQDDTLEQGDVGEDDGAPRVVTICCTGYTKDFKRVFKTMVWLFTKWSPCVLLHGLSPNQASRVYAGAELCGYYVIARIAAATGIKDKVKSTYLIFKSPDAFTKDWASNVTVKQQLSTYASLDVFATEFNPRFEMCATVDLVQRICLMSQKKHDEHDDSMPAVWCLRLAHPPVMPVLFGMLGCRLASCSLH